MTDLTTDLTTEIIDRIYQSFLEGVETTKSGRPKFTMVVSCRTSARLLNWSFREPKRRARKKARNRK